MKHQQQDWNEIWVSLYVVMVIGSACLFTERIGLPNCVQGGVYCGVTTKI